MPALDIYALNIWSANLKIMYPNACIVLRVSTLAAPPGRSTNLRWHEIRPQQILDIYVLDIWSINLKLCIKVHTQYYVYPPHWTGRSTNPRWDGIRPTANPHTCGLSAGCNALRQQLPRDCNKIPCDLLLRLVMCGCCGPPIDPLNSLARVWACGWWRCTEPLHHKGTNLTREHMLISKRISTLVGTVVVVVVVRVQNLVGSKCTLALGFQQQIKYLFWR